MHDICNTKSWSNATPNLSIQTLYNYCDWRQSDIQFRRY